MAKARVATFGRHSTTFQNPESSDDQVRSCRPVVERLDGTIEFTYIGPQISSYGGQSPFLGNK